ncbi:hypothetical protein ILYODFUR_018765 [Ilyodon furcidens]|uniref:Uncharacterized protein n=1 Tax=Ilyodon furcidens TaxID=33524 RepID=A0ABV0SYE9_9TELE
MVTYSVCGCPVHSGDQASFCIHTLAGVAEFVSLSHQDLRHSMVLTKKKYSTGLNNLCINKMLHSPRQNKTIIVPVHNGFHNCNHQLATSHGLEGGYHDNSV